MSVTNFIAIADEIMKMSNEKPYVIVENFFTECLIDFDEIKMIESVTKMSTAIFGPDTNRLMKILSVEDFTKKKFKTFAKMHTKVMALKEELNIKLNSKLLLTPPSIVVNKAKAKEQTPHYDFNVEYNEECSRKSFSIFGMTCTSTSKLIAWIKGNF